MTARQSACALVLLLLAAQAAPAQELMSTGVAPDTVTVGGVFRAVVRVELPAGWRAEFPDTLPVSGAVENAGRRRRMVEPSAGGGRRITVSYPLVAWRTGPATLPDVAVRVAGPGDEGARVLEASLPAAAVASVLPADTAGIEPRPAKDVVGASWPIWPFVLILLGVLIIAAALLYWYRSRREAEPIVVPEAATPRERALAELDRVRGRERIGRGEFEMFYSETAEAVRRYMAALNADWGADLTTSELVRDVRGAVDAERSAELAALLTAADRVKFARHRPTADEAVGTWEGARAWVEAFPWPPRLDADGGGGGGDGDDGAAPRDGVGATNVGARHALPLPDARSVEAS